MNLDVLCKTIYKYLHRGKDQVNSVEESFPTDCDVEGDVSLRWLVVFFIFISFIVCLLSYKCHVLRLGHYRIEYTTRHYDTHTSKSDISFFMSFEGR